MSDVTCVLTYPLSRHYRLQSWTEERECLRGITEFRHALTRSYSGLRKKEGERRGERVSNEGGGEKK